MIENIALSAKCRKSSFAVIDIAGRQLQSDITGGSFTNRVKEPPVSFYKIAVKE